MNRIKTTEEIMILSSELYELIAPKMGGRSPETQGGALAYLVAMWLAGHIVLDDDKKETDEFREEVLGEFVKLVRKLIEPNERIEGRIIEHREEAP